MTALGVSYKDKAPLTADDVPVFFLASVDGEAVGCAGLRPVVSRRRDGREVMQEVQGKRGDAGDGEDRGNGGDAAQWGDIGSGVAEVKRMFVAPSYRGPVQIETTASGEGGTHTSVAGRLLDRLEEEARARGCDVLVLATAACLVGANRFYARCGFVPCGIFGAYGVEDESLYYEKRLGEVRGGRG